MRRVVNQFWFLTAAVAKYRTILFSFVLTLLKDIVHHFNNSQIISANMNEILTCCLIMSNTASTVLTFTRIQNSCHISYKKEKGAVLKFRYKYDLKDKLDCFHSSFLLLPQTSKKKMENQKSTSGFTGHPEPSSTTGSTKTINNSVSTGLAAVPSKNTTSTTTAATTNSGKYSRITVAINLSSNKDVPF
jgi:hypothetical protein